MSQYSLAASGRSDIQVSEIILSRNEETGEPETVLSANQTVELSDEELTKARSLANQVGCQVIEVESSGQNEEVAQREESNQPTGVDTVAAAPEVSDDPGQSPSAPQQGSTTGGAQAGATTTDYGSSATSDTTSNPPTNR